MTTEAKQPTSGLIESRIDKSTTAGLALSSQSGGLAFSNANEVMEFAKIMAVSQQAVPPHCRNQVGICLAIALQAIEWRMSPFAVANKSYVVNDRVAWESQLIHAVIEQRAPIINRLRHEFSGEGQKRRCRVWSTAKGETEPLSYESPEFQAITPKNSPLWKTKPDLQLFYNTSRDWARVYFPDVIMGIYSDDELKDYLDTSQPQAVGKTAPTSLVELTKAIAADEPTPETTPDPSSALDHCDPYLIQISEATDKDQISAVCDRAMADEALNDDAKASVMEAANVALESLKGAGKKQKGLV